MNHKFFFYPALLLLLITVVSCSVSSKHQVYPEPVSKSALRDQQTIEKLYNYFHQWRGTPYRYGGLNKNGVDCSGFVYLAYRSLAGVTLPRSTKQQLQLGQTIPVDALKPGDLLFFKTGWLTRHVGIYIEKGRFVHASTTNGVIISKLSERYWHNAFFVAKRLAIR